MTNPVLSQLVSVEADLVEQIKQLEVQLAQLQAKRQGLHTVIDLFGEDDGDQTDLPVVQPALESSQDTQGVPADEAPESSKSTKATSSRSAATKSVRRTPAKADNTTKTKIRVKAKASSGRKKKDGRAATWQKHVNSKYRDLALPESVSSVLRSTPSEIFTIAEVMSALFKEDMPRTAYLKARNRISNILSAGARDGTWYKGRNGRYSQSESVTKMK